MRACVWVKVDCSAYSGSDSGVQGVEQLPSSGELGGSTGRKAAASTSALTQNRLRPSHSLVLLKSLWGFLLIFFSLQ